MEQADVPGQLSGISVLANLEQAVIGQERVQYERVGRRRRRPRTGRSPSGLLMRRAQRQVELETPGDDVVIIGRLVLLLLRRRRAKHERAVPSQSNVSSSFIANLVNLSICTTEETYTDHISYL